MRSPKICACRSRSRHLMNFVRLRLELFSEFPRARFERDYTARARYFARNSLRFRSRAMHEEDHLDRMLDSALSNYGDSAKHGVEPGLAGRILARVSNETKANESSPGWRNRLVLWAALPVAA